MKFLCIPCDEPMRVTEATVPDEAGSRTVVFRCPRCGYAAAMLTNPAETQLVHALGVRLGPPGEEAGPAEPLAHLRSNLVEARAEAVTSGNNGAEPEWTPAALERLRAAPRFVQQMIRKAYEDYARQRGLRLITPEVMDEARRALGMG